MWHQEHSSLLSVLEVGTIPVKNIENPLEPVFWCSKPEHLKHSNHHLLGVIFKKLLCSIKRHDVLGEVNGAATILIKHTEQGVGKELDVISKHFLEYI